ncbi:MAG: TIGR04552 family protein [Myxococcales bacterium]|nr:TIGR04552 family protein [Myxococcales bacterium]
MSVVQTIGTRTSVAPIGKLSLGELDTLRLMLRGSSVIDWFRLHFEGYEEVDAFLRVNGLEPYDKMDQDRLSDLHQRAVFYLSEYLGYRYIPEQVQFVDDARRLFLMASGKFQRKVRLYACLALKVIHILNYQEGHELLSRLPLSSAEVSILVRAKVERVMRGLLERGFPIASFAGNTKTHSSILSKLLAKKDSQVAPVLDKLRFRIVTERIEDIPPLMCALGQELLPFNYLMPSRSDNTLLDIDRILTRSGNMAAIKTRSSTAAIANESPDLSLGEQRNEFSGPSYRVVSFVSDVPVRVDGVVALQGKVVEKLGRVVFGPVEFQIVDKVSAVENESGENRHTLYKARQRVRVKERLERGKLKTTVSLAEMVGDDEWSNLVSEETMVTHQGESEELGAEDIDVQSDSD